MTKEQNETLNLLFSLLEKAASEMIALGDRSTITSYATCKNLGLFIQKSTSQLKSGDASNLLELWGIFAPTSDWDDSGGSMDLANEIFALLTQEYKDLLSKLPL